MFMDTDLNQQKGKCCVAGVRFVSPVDVDRCLDSPILSFILIAWTADEAGPDFP